MGRSSVTGQFTRTVGAFALIGPPVGTAFVWVWIFFPVPAAVGGGHTIPSLIAFLGSLAGSALATLIVGYVLGVVPAAMTGLVCHFFAQAVRSDTLWVTLCGLTGAIAGALSALILTRTLALDMAILAVPGAMAASACALKLRRSRWA
jgi:hypothetical protein